MFSLAHAKELNNPIPKSPLLFLKPPSSIITKGQMVKLPRQSTATHTARRMVIERATNLTKLAAAHFDRRAVVVVIPAGCTNLHHEVELGVIIGRGS